MSEPKQPSTANASTQVRAESPQYPAQDTGDRNRRRSGSIALVLALIALFLSATLAVSAFFLWNELQQLTGMQAGLGDRVDERIQPLRLSVDGLSDSIDTETAKLERQVQSVETRLQTVVENQQAYDNRLSVLGALMGRSEHGWSLAEVEYLLRIASQRLQLQRDVETAEVALRSADARLRELADPLYQGVREQIAKDVEALGAVPRVDRTGIAATLNAWLDRLNSLPVAGAGYQPKLEKSGADAATTAVDWSEIPAVVWTALSGLFELREHDKPVQPMLAPEREYFLRENLRLQLAAARLALMRDDAEQYGAALSTALDWVKRHFSAENTEVGELASTLAELVSIDIRPGLPDISGSLRLLHQQMKLAEQQDVLPRVPASQAAPAPLSDGDQAEVGADEATAP